MRQEPLYEKIYRDLLQAIESGTYKPGDRLPSEKELSSAYGVSRITSKRALEVLAEEGKIIRMAGKGSFVKDNQDHQGAHIFLPERSNQAECWDQIQQPHLPQRSNQAQRSDQLQSSVQTLPTDRMRAAAEGRVPFIGVILEDFGIDFGMYLLKSVEQTCQERGYHMMLRCTRGSVEAESEAIDELRKAGAEGILMMCVQDETYNAKVLQMVVEGYPVVTVDRQLKGLPVPYIGTDNEEAARELTQYLLDMGCRSLCYVRPAADHTPTLLEREHGFAAVLNEHGIAADENGWITDLKGTLPSAYQGGLKNQADDRAVQDRDKIIRYLKEHPDTDAFLAAEYGIARMVYSCLGENGRRKNCRVVCFDGIEDVLGGCKFTHIRQDEVSMGRIAVETLLDVISGRIGQGTILVPYELRKVKMEEEPC